MNACELSDKVKAEFESHGINFSHIGCSHYNSNTEWVKGARIIFIDPTWRRNGTEEDVTVTVHVSEFTKVIGYSASTKEIIRIKVPKNASDKVIQNRVSKVINAYNN